MTIHDKELAWIDVCFKRELGDRYVSITGVNTIDEYMAIYEPPKPPKTTKDYYLKIGRCCFTCTYRTSRDVNFITCRYSPKHPRIWEKAHCAKWRLAKQRARIAQFDKLIGVKTDPELTGYWYHKNTKVNVLSKTKLKLGRCCFLCEHRGLKHRNKVACEARDGLLVWEKAVCGGFKLTKNHVKLDQLKKYMNKSGVNTSDNVDWVSSRETYEHNGE